MNRGKKFKAINRYIKQADSIFIMGHKDLDLDAIGSALALYQLAIQFGKQAYVVLNDKKHEAGVKKAFDLVKGSVYFITSSQVRSFLTSKSLLLVVDVGKPLLMQDGDLVSKFSSILVLDHHDRTAETIKASFEIIDSDVSSTSEIVTEFLHYHSYKLPKEYLTFLLAGITLDTNDFAIKTSAKTHYAAYYLIHNGASVKDVNILMKQDIEDYILRQKVITDVEVIKKTIAFAKGSNRIFYKKEELAKIADTLLEFNHIETSYVIGKLSESEIGISARSSGEVNIGEILALLGGGGDRHDAACRISNKSIKEVEDSLKKVLGEI